MAFDNRSVKIFLSNRVNSDATTYLRCRVDRRPPAPDRANPEIARLRSLNADAFHSKFARKGPSLIQCVARFMGDDTVNICGDYHLVTECHGGMLRVLGKSEIVAPGDAVELFTYDGRRLPNAIDGGSGGRKNHGYRKNFMQQQKMDVRLRHD